MGFSLERLSEARIYRLLRAVAVVLGCFYGAMVAVSGIQQRGADPGLIGYEPDRATF